jgi:uncharacterized SAM-binding protein YcdF (DUF218 family)
MMYQNLVRHFSLAASIATLIAIAFIYVFAGQIYDYHDTMSPESLPSIDAIVCLGGGRGRITAAGDIWYRYWEQAQKAQSEGTETKQVPILYLSGMGPQTNWALLSRQLRPAILQKIRPGLIVVEKESVNTDANARWFARYAQQQNWKKVLLLTSSYHMKRAKFIFNQVLKKGPSPIELETLSIAQEPFTAEEWRSGPNGIRVTLLEYLKWLYYSSVWRPV